MTQHAIDTRQILKNAPEALQRFERVPDGVNVPKGSYIQIELGYFGVFRIELDGETARELANTIINSYKG